METRLKLIVMKTQHTCTPEQHENLKTMLTRFVLFFNYRHMTDYELRIYFLGTDKLTPGLYK